jgi:hypothetical protein
MRLEIMKPEAYVCKMAIGLTLIYRIIHKFVKHFKNSQQINYASDHRNSYADRE